MDRRVLIGCTQLRDRAEGPSKAPSWVRPELIDETIRTWQPLASDQLTPTDAVSILANTAELFDAVGLFAPREQEREDEAVDRPGESQQPRAGT
jgi:hypothetical protein